MIFVNQNGKRFWDEGDGSHGSFAAAMACTGDKTKLNGGGPIWAIFDADAVAREKWKPKPPHVDRDGYFFSADTIPELAKHRQPLPEAADLGRGAARDRRPLQFGFVAAGADADFKKPTPLYKIEKPPFYAAWTHADPARHLDRHPYQHRLAGDRHPRQGHPWPLCLGDSAGGFGQHGIARAAVPGRIAGFDAAGQGV